MGAKLATFLVAVGASLVGAPSFLPSWSATRLPGGRDATDVESLGVLFLCGFTVVLAWCAWLWLGQGHRRPRARGLPRGYRGDDRGRGPRPRSPSRYIALDPEVLAIRFDGRGRVRSVAIRRT